ncbi:MAG: NAD(P)-dependent oxidoreductase [Actinomycetota bacterium]|nr:NAD(P)-dependent oxidoreductase [Actinomycetota bacterium]
MGGPIGGHLARAGVPVVVADLDRAAVQACEAQGMTAAADLADLAARSDVVLVVVATDDDVLGVCRGERGLLAGSRPGTTLLLCSSVRPDTCEAVAAEAPDGVAVLDAALTGGVRGAENGTVNLLVGGDADALDRVRPALAPWTSSVHHLGPLGAGQVGKTVNNMVHWAQISAITEALELGRRYGLDVPTLRRALMDGPTDSRTLRELEQMRFTWHAKDLANAEAMAQGVGLPLPVADTAREVMKGVTVQGIAELLAGGSAGITERTVAGP